MNNKTQIFAYIFISSLVLYFIFAPSVNMLFYAGDDFRYGLGGYSKSCGMDDSFYFMFTLGRPLQAYLDCLSYKFAFSFERMRIIRLIAVLLMGCGMGLMIAWFQQLRFSLATAFFSAGIFFLVRPLYEDTISLGALSLPLSMLLVIVAYYCVKNAYSKGFLIFCSMLTYPALSFFFITLILSKLVFSKLDDWIKTRREIIREVIIFCCTAIVYFAWGYYNMHYHAKAPIPEAYHLDKPNINLAELLNRLYILGNLFDSQWVMFGFGNVRLEGWLTIILLPLGIVGGAIQFLKSRLYRENKQQSIKWLSQAVMGAIALLILSSAFYLVIPSRSLIEYRFLFGALSSRLILLFWCIRQFSFSFRDQIKYHINLFIVVLFFLYASVQANIYMLVTSLAFGEYYNTAEMAISGYLAKHHSLRRVHFIFEKPENTYNGFFLVNAALTRLSGNNQTFELKWCSLPRGEKGEEKDHQKEALACIKQAPSGTISVTYSYTGDSFAKTPDMLVIEMQKLNRTYYYHFLKRYLTNYGKYD